MQKPRGLRDLFQLIFLEAKITLTILFKAVFLAKAVSKIFIKDFRKMKMTMRRKLKKKNCKAHPLI
jgi:hypothetical protein